MAHFLRYFFIILLYSQLHPQPVGAEIGSFTMDIFHRDSPLSPFYNHSLTPLELVKNDILRSIARSGHFFLRLNNLQTPNNDVESLVIPNDIEYLMQISIGTPSVKSFVILDTGSDLMWIQCKPCKNCYSQDFPLFDPSQSSSYKKLPCNLGICKDLPSSSCGRANECEYSYSYFDKSFTNGIMAMDTITIGTTNGRAMSFPNTVFGCGYDNNGVLFTGSPRAGGLFGLGSGPLSLISQLGNKISHKFSYCLVPRTVNSASKLKFGSNLLGDKVVSTPMIINGNHYLLTLLGVSIRDNYIAYNYGYNNANDYGSNNPNEGNIMIDSGTTGTMLEPTFFNELVNELTKIIGLSQVRDPLGYNSVCYDAKSFRNRDPEIKMVFHFVGADVTLTNVNIFRSVGHAICMTILPTNGMNIFGNWAQANFQVEYDIGKEVVSFAPADCTKY